MADEHRPLDQDQESGRGPPADLHERAATGPRVRAVGDHGCCGFHPGKDTPLDAIAGNRAEQRAAILEKPETPSVRCLHPDARVQYESVELADRDNMPDDYVVDHRAIRADHDLR